MSGQAKIFLAGIAAVVLTTAFFGGTVGLLFASHYIDAWWELKKIEGVEITRLDYRDDYVSAEIEVKGKGKMVFGSLFHGQINGETLTTRKLAIGGVGECRILIITEESPGYAKTKRGFALVEEEVGVPVKTVAQAVERYDEILERIKSWPDPPIGEIPAGQYAECGS